MTQAQSGQPASSDYWLRRVLSLPEDQRQELLRLTMPKRSKYWIHEPTEPQAAFLLLDCLEALYGGAAGGGKSDALLMGALQYVDTPGYAAGLFRKTYADLTKPGALIDRSHQWLQGTDATWNEQKKLWRFPSGAVIQFGHLEHENDIYNYQGAEFQYLGFDELTQLSLKQYRYLLSRLRRLKGVKIPLRARAGSNPGGVGHDWVRNRFLIAGPAAGRVFVPAKLEDNPHLDVEEYELSLAELDDVTRRQLRQGDWSVRDKDNALVPEWTAEVAKACTRVVERPEYFTPYIAGDLGSRDLTAWGLGHWNFERAELVVENELPLVDPSTDEIGHGLLEKMLETWGKDNPSCHSLEKELEKIGPGGAPTDAIAGLASSAFGAMFGHEKPRFFSDVDWRLVKDLKKWGINLVPTKKDDALGHRNKARTMVGRQKVVIHPRCSTLLLTLESALWNEKRTDFQRQEGIGHADFWAMLIYLIRNIAAAHNPEPVVKEAVPGERLLRQKRGGADPRTPAAKSLARAFGRK
jgi:hypothetical protein